MASAASASGAAAAEAKTGAYKPLDIAQYMTALNARRQPSAIRSLMPLLQLPGMISLGGGLPNPALFPFKQLSFSLADGTNLSLTEQELNAALQYSPTPGLPVLLQQLRELQEREHSPPLPFGEKGWTVSVSTGSSDALYKAFDLLVEEGDSVLCEAPTYSGSLAALRPLKANLVELPVDEFGLIPSKLESMLATFGAVSGRSKPRVLYVIPTGQNPAGCTLTDGRKKEIYALACKHDLIILEDDPYYYLSYGRAAAPAVGTDSQWQRPTSRSFFSMDTEGRVLRFDSFSKILSSGLRLGMVSGPAAFIQRIDYVSQAAALHTSGVSQAMVSKLLKHWGAAGWSEHIRQVCLFYARRRDAFIQRVEKHLKGLVTYTVPEAGMFVYFKLHGVADSKKLVETGAKDARVLLVPGQAFSPNDKPSDCVRASFSTASDEDMDTALQRFAKLLKEETKNQQPQSKL